VAVAVVAAAPHREEAFAACRAAIERIKATVPIWKKEFGPGGNLWIDGCAAGRQENC
jgi:molybdopterin synthase catalytic subunit